ncbi:MAG: Ig-like domain-containing protein, partial [Bacteroidales bacterium]|nr:Ig-like domain-containing protein [Bacteroidales bacterium]
TNTGSLFNGQTEVKSDEVVETSGTEVTFTVGNTGEAENGQVRIKEVEVVYTGSGTLPPADMPDTQTSITAPSAITVYLGETVALNASSNVNATITYESEDTAVATVDGNGVVTGHALGTTKVWARIAAVPGDYTAAEHYTTVTVAEKPVAGDGTWVETALGNIADGAQFVVVSTNAEGASYAMSNDNGTGAAPSAVAVTVASGKLSSAPASNLVWKMEKTQAGYVFHKDDETWLYATDTNNGLRVGKGAANEVVVEAETGYMTLTIQKETGNVTRYIGVYNKADWRCYTSINNNIKDQAFTYFVKQ